MPWRGPEESPLSPPGTAPHGTDRPGRVDRPGWCTPMVPQRQANELPPPAVADWLASVFEDRKSYSGFKARCEEAWWGELPVDRLVSAYEQAMGPQAKNRGAIFMYAVRQNG